MYTYIYICHVMYVYYIYVHILGASKVPLLSRREAAEARVKACTQQAACPGLNLLLPEPIQKGTNKETPSQSSSAGMDSCPSPTSGCNPTLYTVRQRPPSSQ